MVQIQLQQNRYLWVHFAGLAAVPLLLDLCLAGVASAGPAFDYPAAGSLLFWLIALLGTIPTLWMQLAKPFYMFSLPPLALNPNELTDDQRRCLQLLKSLQVKIIAGVTAFFALWLLWQIYARSPQVTPLMTPTAGLISAAVAFFFTCMILQISISAGRSLFVGPETLKRVVPVEVDAIASDFLILGLRVNKILPSEIYASPSSESSIDLDSTDLDSTDLDSTDLARGSMSLDTSDLDTSDSSADMAIEPISEDGDLG